MSKQAYYSTIVFKTLVDVGNKKDMEAEAWKKTNEISKLIPNKVSVTIEDRLSTVIVEPNK